MPFGRLFEQTHSTALRSAQGDPREDSKLAHIEGKPFRFIIYESEGRFTNRPYNNNGMHTPGGLSIDY